LVTGAGAGLGQAYARRLAADGAEVILADLQSPDATAELIRADGGKAHTLVVDIANEASTIALGKAVADLGGADILVNNAGIYPGTPFDKLSFAEWRKVVSVNVDGLYLVTSQILPGMRQRGWGRVICASSTTFYMGNAAGTHYVATKGAVIGFVRALSAEVGVDGVTVNAVAPGLIRTKGTTELFDEQAFVAVPQMQAIKRGGLPDDLAPTVSFLASDDAAYITGQTIVIDGGMAHT
jgi:NAD(P)-dependent dehydrogenase (short-subunit alcohol dehydrogenase family)